MRPRLRARGALEGGFERGIAAEEFCNVTRGAFADVADQYSRGFGHITTRQNLQFHFIKLHDMAAAMQRLAESGLTTREACGNSVRNITACPYAGVGATEVFDVTPYSDAMTRYFLRHPLSSSLPRKFKIVLAVPPDNDVDVFAHDLGFIAILDKGKVAGWNITIGGGMGMTHGDTKTFPRTGDVMGFCTSEQVVDVAEKIVTVQRDWGNRELRSQARLKYTIETRGLDAYRAEVEKRLA